MISESRVQSYYSNIWERRAAGGGRITQQQQGPARQFDQHPAARVISEVRETMQSVLSRDGIEYLDRDPSAGQVSLVGGFWGGPDDLTARLTQGQSQVQFCAVQSQDHNLQTPQWETDGEKGWSYLKEGDLETFQTVYCGANNSENARQTVSLNAATGTMTWLVEKRSSWQRV